MDSYIVRIYRRGAEEGKEIAGLVERIGNGGRMAFGSSKELWAFLTENRPARKGAVRVKPDKEQR